MAKIGLLGGTFDPIHNGHTQSLVSIKQQLNLDQIWVMPNAVAPHKPQPQANGQHRLAMVELAIADLDGVKAVDFELTQTGPSYTVYTLEKLQQRYPNNDFYFIIGMDSLANFNHWYKWHQILNFCNLLVMTRPGCDALDIDELDWYQQIKESLPKGKGSIYPVKTDEVDISSTHIRNCLKLAQVGKFDINPAVKRYIEQHNLYQ
ncbi:nicotinate (nicotinamide) nucleotide adenylyltransferase [Paraferrimonas sp. SM1919]|uniref:nicotinate (nicotinamide) nucleotide adenylyltransferase n=1 Tax=Paraferrimonas sp. SM1919 TaxID=2662263 RepID=UPI0013D71B5D|nr:nicotinate (nicotinamide) nucleotide adenylyltransferase [Paraferrimonas sp. SM1919]